MGVSLPQSEPVSTTALASSAGDEENLLTQYIGATSPLGIPTKSSAITARSQSLQKAVNMNILVTIQEMKANSIPATPLLAPNQIATNPESVDNAIMKPNARFTDWSLFWSMPSACSARTTSAA